MAEALGVIASVVQITDTSIKLRKLWTGIKEMPETVRDMIEDVDLLANTFSQIQNVPVPSSSAQQNTPAWRECCRALQLVNTSFQVFVTDLDKQMTAHKKSGSLRAFLKRDKIVEWQDRLSRLKMTMLMAQQAYTQALFAQQCTTIIDTLQAMNAPQSAALPTSQPTTKMLQAPDGGAVSKGSDLPAVRVANSSSGSTVRGQNERQFNVQLPNWVLRKSLQVLVSRSYGSWAFNLRVYNRVPRNSEVFVAAERGQWTEVQSLFNRGKATPFDVLERGQSLMHVTARNADAYGCRFLLKHGLEPAPRTIYPISPMESLALGQYSKRGTADVSEVARILAPSFEDYVLNDEKNFIGFYRLPIEVIRHLATVMSSTYGTIEPIRRARSVAAFSGANPESIPLILGPNLSLSKALSLLCSSSLDGNACSHRDILSELMRHLLPVMWDDSAVQVLAGVWRHVVKEIIVTEGQLDAPLRFGGFIRHFLRSCFYEGSLSLQIHEHGSIWSQKLSSVVRIWVKFLLALGVNLENYAKAEKHYFMTQADNWNRSLIDGFAIRLNGLTCGPNIDDWSVYAVLFDSPYFERYGGEYEMAGSFWAWIEDPELFLIPGAYLDHPEEYPIRPKNCMIKGPIF